ncbi:glycosyltransferase family 2 protein [Bacillus salipaludis]|uniref:Glycosyltransferase family 2 protein n=1 Tax=Bacillus salipaludis TaxID=2547811 RepID=A0ABW8RB95_9BACI
MTKVSVVVIAYNIEHYIKKCLESIMNQTFEDLEVVVVNDGSTDQTLMEIEKVATLDSRIRVIDKENGGAMEARYSGFKSSKGNYILFVDGDDWIHKETVERLHKNAMEENCDIVLYNYYLVYKDNLKPSKSYTDQLHKIDDNLKCSLLCYITPSLWAKFIKRSFLIDNKIDFPNNLSYAEDLAMVINLFICKPKISILDKNLYYYLQREDSITKSLDNRVFDIPRAVNYIRSNLIKEGLYQKYKEEFDYLAYTHIFYNKIICTNNYNDIHKKINDAWKRQKININRNKYFIKLKKNSSFGLRIKMRLFNYNHRMGLFYLSIRRSMGIRY